MLNHALSVLLFFLFQPLHDKQLLEVDFFCVHLSTGGVSAVPKFGEGREGAPRCIQNLGKTGTSAQIGEFPAFPISLCSGWNSSR